MECPEILQDNQDTSTEKQGSDNVDSITEEGEMGGCFMRTEKRHVKHRTLLLVIMLAVMMTVPAIPAFAKCFGGNSRSQGRV